MHVFAKIANDITGLREMGFRTTVQIEATCCRYLPETNHVHHKQSLSEAYV